MMAWCLYASCWICLSLALQVVTSAYLGEPANSANLKARSHEIHDRVEDQGHTCTGGQVWSNCGGECYVDCGAGKELRCLGHCKVGCICPADRPIWHDDQCITFDEYDCAQACTGGQVWSSCGTECQVICGADKLVACPDMCKVGCSCPSDRPIWHNDWCITVDQYECTQDLPYLSNLKVRSHDSQARGQGRDQECPRGKIPCPGGNGGCIRPAYVCDGSSDCGDGSDEAGCAPPTCAPDQFACRNGHCVRQSYICDADNDCGDWSDEQNCLSRPCPDGRFQCPLNGRCIPEWQVCDGVDNCRDGTDELNCQCRDGLVHSDCVSSCPPTCETPNPAPCQTMCEPGCQCPDDRPIQFNDTCITADECPTCTGGQVWSSCGSECYVDCGAGQELRCLGLCQVGCTCPSDRRIWQNGQCITADQYDCSLEEQLTTERPSCDDEHWPCESNLKCIYRSYVCDGEQDCADNSDERNCGGRPGLPDKKRAVDSPVRRGNHVVRAYQTATCSTDKFECGDGKCIEQSYVCDGEADCSDYSDETRCRTGAPSSGSRGTCRPGQFECSRGGKCIDASYVCDDEPDCNDWSDEDNCPGSQKQKARQYFDQLLGPALTAT